MKPIHVVLIAIAASLAGIITLAGVLFVGFVGVYHEQNGCSLLAMKA